MKTKDFMYLTKELGEDMACLCLKAPSNLTHFLVLILKKTNIKNVLSLEDFKDFCYKFLFGRYGRVLGDFLLSLECIENVDFLYDYLKDGYLDMVAYQELFQKKDMVSLISKKMGKERFECFLAEEILFVESQKVSVQRFLELGGSLPDLIEILKKYSIKEFNILTNIPFSEMESQDFSYQVSIFQITSYVCNIEKLSLDIPTEKELFEAYYMGLLQNIRNGFSTDVLVLQNKPFLFRFLKEQKAVSIPLDASNKKLSLKDDV